MHGLDVRRCRSLRHDTAVMAYLLDPGEGKYTLEDLALRYLSVELHVARSGRGHARPRRRRRRRGDRPPRRDRCCGSSTTLRRGAATRASSSSCTSGSSGRSSACSRKMEDGRRPHRRRVPRRARQGARRPVPPARGRDPRARGRAVQRQLDAAAAPHPVREARPHAGEEDEDRPVDRRRLAAEDGRGAPDRRDAAALPGGREAAQHLRRRAAAARRAPTAASTRRSTSSRPPPAASRARRRTCRTSRCAPPSGRELRRAFIADEGCGLLTADYSQIELRVLAHLADDPGLIDAFERGADVHTTTAARVFDVDEDEGRRVPAPLREGRELRARVRHGGLRPRRSGSTSRPTRPARSSTRTSTRSRTSPAT